MFPGTFETNPHKSKHETTNLRNVLHWVTTLLLAPILLMGYEQMTSSGMIRNAHGIVVLFWGLGFIFSAPIFALYLIIFKFLLKKTKSRLTIKAVLNMVGVMSIAIIFLLIDYSGKSDPPIPGSSLTHPLTIRFDATKLAFFG